MLNLGTDVYMKMVTVPGTLSTGLTAWQEATDCERFAWLLALGATDNTVDFKIQQASDSSGTGAKDIADGGDSSVKAEITQLVGTDDNKYVLIEVQTAALDEGFGHVAASLTVAGTTTGSLLFMRLNNGYKPVTQPTELAEKVVIVG